MILAPHEALGAAIALRFPDKPVLGFALAFLSHFFLDAVPHWQYKIPAFNRARDAKSIAVFLKDKMAIFDILAVLVDFLGGISIVALAAGSVSLSRLPIALLGAVGGALPDFLQFAYVIFPESPLRYLQEFHKRANFFKESFPQKPVLGTLQQIVFTAVFAATIIFLG